MQDHPRAALFGILVFAVGLIVVLVGQHARAVPAVGSQQTVIAVCTRAHEQRATASCAKRDGTIHADQVATAGLAISVLGRVGFPATTAHFSLWARNADGSSTSMGSFDDTDMPLTDNSVLYPLGSIFDRSGAAPHAGTTYQLEIDSGGTALGTVEFTYAA